MSLRRIAGLLAAFGLVVGLIGGGVSAAFTDSATAAETIHVGTFGCAITAATQGADIASDGSSVTYAAPEIMSSAAGTAQFRFTVSSTGTIPVKVHVTQSVPTAPFTSVLTDPVPVVTLGGLGTSTEFAAGLAWPTLENEDLDKTASITYSVNCIELSALIPPGIAVVCPQEPDGQGGTAYNWTVTLAGQAPNYNLDWSTDGITWSDPVDWSPENDPIVGGGWSGPMTTTSAADNGGDHLWVRWSSDPSVVTGPVANACS